MKSLLKVLVAVAAGVSLTGCAQHQSTGPVSSGSADAGKPHIVFIFKVMGISYSDSLQQGVDRANKELGVNAELIGPSTGNDIQGQINLIEQQIARKVDAVVISANDADSVKPAMDKATAAGIKVYTWDSDSPGSKRLFYVAGCDDVQIGRDVAARLAEDIGEKGKVGIMTGTLTANNLRLHVQGVREELKKHPQITVVEPLLACNDQKDQAVNKAISLLQAHPDLAGMAGVCSPAAPGTAEALIQAGKAGKVKVWGISLPSEVKPYLKKGIVQGAILWNPADLTYAAAMLVRDNLKTGAMPKDGQEIPGIGKLSVKGEQVLIPGAVITRENVDRFDF
ncbi:MAG: autoinducer 2 ABC transporter substrate-binding protein [Armatimonadetes bacterium]|nr:autoinducer 2 ABC transporter substrate-binding protein [Armatimonadota bacterium]